ncbi:MAG: alpha-amylase family protein [Cytophagaceae bacterium]
MKYGWYKNAVLYSLDIKTFKDSESKGIGDFKGLTEKLGYLSYLGITCIWILPFHPSPKIDDGYDVCDYYNVDPALGTLGDFVEFIEQAKEKGIRVIMDLVVNHTSIEHPWFKMAKSDKKSKYRDYYVWTDKPKRNKEKIMFEGIEDSIWEYTKETDSYYLHRFFKEQADLNISNKEVRNEIIKTMKFWLKLGVSGFRVDAAHIITDPVDVEHIDFGNLHELFDEMRELIEEVNPEAVLLGEACVSPEEQKKYFADKERNKHRIHMLFNFLSNKYTMLALAEHKGKFIKKGLDQLKEIHLSHWVNFVRHHDELNLELLTEKERQEVFKAFAPEDHMRIFGHGIRRRLPPMLNNNPSKIKLIYAIIFGLPGIPVINYGEEIGMGDDLNLEGRQSVRTVMQWTSEKNAGFSNAPKSKLYRPVIEKGQYDYKKLNVDTQIRDEDSLLNWMIKLIGIRKQTPIIGTGEWDTVKSNKDEVAGIIYKSDFYQLLVVYNLSVREINLKLDLQIKNASMADIFTDSEYERPKDTGNLKLNRYGYRWIKIQSK